MGEVAALVSAITAVAGLLLGFFGLPAVVDSPTAKTVTVTETVHATATVTVTASPPPAAAVSTPGLPSPAPLPSGEVALRDLTTIGIVGNSGIQLRSATMGGKTYSNAMVFTYPCQINYEYSINQRYKTLTLIAGIDDNGVARHGKLSISADGKERKNVMLEINNPQPVTVDMSGVVMLQIVSNFGDESCDAEGAVVALADAVLRS
ncbi:NPCBM/NEW2 domain-containing protein [Kitasatospora sp. NPDC058218]|uniref:NPCBM/NEW2 domain-containing protein n=1 Tax=Kitasatospora sp. NPDC058218 TaxID=3346385 RepID=UPI0036DB8797